MSKLKFRTQLIIGFVILIFINFLITNHAIVQIRSISSDTQLIYEHPLIVSNAVRDINININAIHRTMKDLVLSENTEQFNNSQQLVNYYDSLNYVAFKIVKEKFLGNKSIVDDAYKTVKDWEIIRNEVIELQKAGNNIEAIKITKGKGAEHVKLVFEKTKTLTDFAQNKADELYQETIRRRDKSIKMLYASTFLFFLLSFLVSFIISKSILKPINKFIVEINSIHKKKSLLKKEFFTRSEQEILSDTALELKTAYETLESFNAELEHKVEVRTIEVNAQNEELKERELILQENETNLKSINERFELATNASGVSVWEHDFITDIIKIDDNFITIYGSTQGNYQIEFKDFIEFIHPDDVDIIKINIEEAIISGNNMNFEFRIIRPDGDIRNINAYGKIVKDETNKPVKFIGVNIDISDFRKAELLLKENERKLFQINNDKDRFISILGHDLRSPFNNLLGLSELLTKNIHKYDIDKIENFANQINKSAIRSFNLLDNLLNWSRAQQGNIPFKPQNLSLTDVCNDVLITFNPTADAKSIVINCLAEDHQNVFADNDMIKTVLRNLVSNAIKFTNSGGAINISAEENSENITISVSDNGIGIPPENLAKLFDISEVLTTKGTAKETGTGLGLLLCKEFVEKHGGVIWVVSEVGKGSDFRFTLPCNAEPKLIQE